MSRESKASKERKDQQQDNESDHFVLLLDLTAIGPEHTLGDALLPGWQRLNARLSGKNSTHLGSAPKRRPATETEMSWDWELHYC